MTNSLAVSASRCCRRCSSTPSRSAVDQCGCLAHPSSDGCTTPGALLAVAANQLTALAMHSPFVDSASFLSEGPLEGGRHASAVSVRLLAFALVMAVAASSAVLLAFYADGPPRMEARPTGSGRERSSPNRCDQCRGKARKPYTPSHERTPTIRAHRRVGSAALAQVPAPRSRSTTSSSRSSSRPGVRRSRRWPCAVATQCSTWVVAPASAWHCWSKASARAAASSASSRVPR